jgi:uncharacterized DUF497 family protein
MIFRWHDWNIDHIAQHAVEPEEAEYVVERARPPFPRRIEDDKFLVWGRTSGGRLLQVIFVRDIDQSIFVLHARPLENHEKRRLSRTKK